MKKVILIWLAIILTLALFAVSASADGGNGEIRVILNGVELEFDVPPMMIDNNVMIPMRAVFEAVGMEVEWDDNEQEQRIIAARIMPATGGVRETRVIIGHPSASVRYIPLSGYGWGSSFWLDARAQIVNNRTMIPIRVIEESLRPRNVNWDDETQTLTIQFTD